MDDIDWGLESGFLGQVIFTKAGTYMVTYPNSELAISTWSWVSQSEGTLRYSWNLSIT